MISELLHRIPKNLVGAIHNSLFDKDASIWVPPLAAKGSRRGASSRINDFSRYSTKARWIRTNPANKSIFNDLLKISISNPHNILLMRGTSNKSNMHSANRSKGFNSLFIHRTHENSSSWHILTNGMGPKRSPYADDCPWIGVIRIILSG